MVHTVSIKQNARSKKMTFIGIISEEKTDRELEKIIDNQILIKSTIVNININNIEHIKNVKFETILIMESQIILSKLEILKKILGNTQYLIINSDIKSNLSLLDNLELNVITFGFNSKATITASSVNEENALICIQRNIIDRKNNIIEPQEIKINLKKIKDIYKVMGIVGVALIYQQQNMEKNIKI